MSVGCRVTRPAGKLSTTQFPRQRLAGSMTPRALQELGIPECFHKALLQATWATSVYLWALMSVDFICSHSFYTLSNSGTTTQGKPGAEKKNMKLKAFIKSSNMTNTLPLPISFYPAIGVYWSSYTEQELTATVCTVSCTQLTQVHSLHFCLPSCKIILYFRHVLQK